MNKHGKCICLAAMLIGLFCSTGWPQEQNTAGTHWWEAEPLRIIHVVTSFNELTAQTPSQWALRKADHAYNSEHFDVMNMFKGLDDQGFFFSSRMAGKKNEDYMARYMPEAKKQGLRVMIYFNVHWYTREFGEKHRDWLQTKEDGTPLAGVYTTGTDFCVNSPWREWVFQILRDLCAYPIDGIFFDGPIFFPETCYCRYCQEKYKQLHGTALPSKKERRGPAAQELLMFQAGSLTEFLRDSRKILKAVNPEIAFYMNGGERGGNWATARLNRMLIQEQDILGSEGGFIGGDLNRVPIWKPGVTARLLESQSAGKPRVIFSAAAHKSWTFSILPEPELRLLYAGTIANAAGVWFGMWPEELELPEMSALVEMNRFLKKNNAYYQNTKSEAKVALVWSDTSANFYSGSDAQLLELERVPQRSEVGNLNGEFSGFAHALIRSQIPFDVIDDQSLLEGNLGKYRAVLLPNVACMSDRVASRLQEYVREGGNLVATFETSLYDETGNRRKDMALAEVLGVSSNNHIVGPKRWDFMKARGKNPLTDHLHRDLIPSPFYHLQVKPVGGEVLLQFTKPLTGVYDGIPVLSDDPAMVERRFGKGRVVYFPGDMGNGIQNFHLGEFYDLLSQAVRRMAPSPVVLENAPASIEMVLRSQQDGKRLLLHLINFTGEMVRPIRRIVPLQNLRISMQSSGGKHSIRSLMGSEVLQAKSVTKDRMTFVLPLLKEYEVIVIEKEN